MYSEGATVPAGWYPDPTQENTQRYWDGAQWTQHVQPKLGPPPTTQQYPADQNPAQSSSHDTTRQYQEPQYQEPQYRAPHYQQPQYQQPQYAPGPGPGPIGAPAPGKSGMSTGVKVLLGLLVLGLLTLGGCVVAIGLVVSSDDFQDQLDEIEQLEEGGLDQLPTTEDPFDDGQPLVGEEGPDDGTAGSDGSGGNTGGAVTAGVGTRSDPHPFDQPVELTWDTFGDADGSVWTTTVGPPRDITDQVLADNQFNNPPPDGVRYVGFDVELTLVDAAKEPLAPGFNFTWELLGGSTAAAYDFRTIETESFGCGLFDESFDGFSEVFETGTLSGTVCVPLPAEDLDHPDTQVALHFIGDTRAVFGP